MMLGSAVSRELAWAVWEFCADSSADMLDLSRARRFLNVYGGNEGPVQVEDRSDIVPLIRAHLRYEIRRALAVSESGGAFARGHVESQIRAFAKLRRLSL